jgi:hypothetical protein
MFNNSQFSIRLSPALFESWAILLAVHITDENVLNCTSPVLLRLSIKSKHPRYIVCGCSAHHVRYAESVSARCRARVRLGRSCRRFDQEPTTAGERAGEPIEGFSRRCGRGGRVLLWRQARACLDRRTDAARDAGQAGSLVAADDYSRYLSLEKLAPRKVDARWWPRYALNLLGSLACSGAQHTRCGPDARR